MSARRAAGGVLFALASAVVYREVQPFQRASNNLLAHVAQYSVREIRAREGGQERRAREREGRRASRRALLIVCANVWHLTFPPPS